MSQCRSFGSNYHPSSQSRKISIGIVVDQFAKTKPNGVRENVAVVPITGNLGSSIVNTPEDTHKNEKVKDTSKVIQTEAAVNETSPWVDTRSCHQILPSGVCDAKQDSSSLLNQGQRYNGSNKSQQHPVQFNLNQMSVLQSDDELQKKFNSVTYGRKGQRNGSSKRVDEVSFATAQEVKVPVEEVAQEEPVNTETKGNEDLRMKIWEVLGAVSTPTKEFSNSQSMKSSSDNLETDDKKKSSTVKPRQNSDTIESDSDSPNQTMKRPVTRSSTRKRPIKDQQPKTKNVRASSDKHKLPEKATFSFEEGWSRRNASATIGGSSDSKSKKKNTSRIESHKLHFPKRSNTDETLHVTDSGKMKDHVGGSSGFNIGTSIFCGSSLKENRDSYLSPSMKKTDKLGDNYQSIFPKYVDEQEYVDSSLKNNSKPQFDFNSPSLEVNPHTETCFNVSSPKNEQEEQEDVYSPMKGIIKMENIRSFKKFFASDPDSNKKNKETEIFDDEVEHEDSPLEPQFDFNTCTLGINPPSKTCFGGSSPKNHQGKEEDVHSPIQGVHNMNSTRSFDSFFALKPDSDKKNRETETSDDEAEHDDSPVRPQFGFNTSTLGMNPPPKTCFDSSSSKNNQGKQEDICNPVKGVLHRENIQSFKNFFASTPESDKKHKEREISDDEVEHENFPVEKSLSNLKEINAANRPSTPSSEEDGSESCDEEDGSESCDEGSLDGSESCDEGPTEAETPESVAAQEPEILFRPTKRCRINEGADASIFSPLTSPKVPGKFHGLPSELNEENGLAGAVSLFAMVLERVISKMKSVANKRSAEILTSVAMEMHLQLQNAESQIQTDVRKLTGIGKTKRRRLETRFQEQQEQLKDIYERFRNEVNLHLEDCRSTFEGLELQQTEFKDIVEKQKASHGKLMLHAEEAIKSQLNDAQKRISTVRKSTRQKMLQLKYVIAECLKDDVLY